MMKQKVANSVAVCALAKRRLTQIGLFAALAAASLSKIEAANYTLPTQQAAGLDWNSPSWLPAPAAGATTIVGADPAATFEMLPGSRLRSPNNGVDDTFPGLVLLVDGDSIMAPTGSGATSSEIRFKQAGSGAATFPQLVLNGGQLDTGNDNTIVINGALEVRKDSSLINDGTNDRGMLINSYLTGSGKVSISTYASGAFRPAYTHNINVAGTTNKFAGEWNVIRGALLGSADGALGTNNITVGTDGAIEATYNINNPKGNLQLNGRFYLTHDHSFRAVTVGTVALTKGTHTFDELSTTYPNNFPTSWTALIGAETDNGPSGSITVLEDNTTPVALVNGISNVTIQAGTPAVFTVQVSGPVTSVQWLSNNVVVAGATSLTFNSGPLGVGANGTVYKVIVGNSVNSVNSSATVTVNDGPLTITSLLLEAIGQDWNTIGMWSDGNAASVSAAANSQNIYAVVAGTRLRSPDNGVNDTFPGNTLMINGNSVFVNDPPAGSPTGELRFKQAGGAGGTGTATFPKLVMNGGQLDTGNDGTIIITGEIDIAKTTHVNNNAANDRGYRIDAFLAGAADVNLHLYQGTAFLPNGTHNFNVAGNTNTFSGKWNVIAGVLLGTGANGLGTNDITVGANAALQTTYDINSKGTLSLQGQLFLTQTDTFRTVMIGTTPLAKGTYTFEQLATDYPANFPSSWTAQVGAEDAVTPTGAIVVLEDNNIPVAIVTPPANTRLAVGQTALFTAVISGPATSIQWYKNNVLIDGATSLTYTTDPVTADDNNATYKVVISNNVNSVQASATLTIGQLVTTQGFLKEEVWVGTAYNKDNIQSTTDVPTTVRYLTSFETPSNQSDNFADRVSGWFTPKVTGDYIFFIASDDDSYLFLSTNADPNNKVLIATQTGYSGVRGYSSDGNAADTAAVRDAMVAAKRSDSYLQTVQGAAAPVLIHLVKDTAYYIEADHHDGTGGDNVAVTFILAGQATPPDGTAPALAGLTLSVQSIDGATLSITDPVAQTAAVGGTATFTTTATSSSTNIFYQWQKNGVDIAGANSASYTTPTLAAGDDADYRVIASTPGAPLQTSASAHLTVGATVPPNAATIKNVTLSAGAIHFAFGTQTGVAYTVEYKTALTDATWTTLNVVTGTGADGAVDDNIGAGPRFYRVTAR